MPRSTLKRLKPLFMVALAALLLIVLSSCTLGPCGVVWIWESRTSPPASPPETNQVLTAEAYAPTEAVYRTFLPGKQWPESRTNFIYCLSFGGLDAPLPADFMARFSDPMPTVITRTNGLVFSPGVMLEPKSGRPVVKLTLYRLSIHANRADARVFYIGGSEVVTETLQLTRQAGRWNVTGMKEITRSYF